MTCIVIFNYFNKISIFSVWAAIKKIVSILKWLIVTVATSIIVSTVVWSSSQVSKWFLIIWVIILTFPNRIKTIASDEINFLDISFSYNIYRGALIRRGLPNQGQHHRGPSRCSYGQEQSSATSVLLLFFPSRICLGTWFSYTYLSYDVPNRFCHGVKSGQYIIFTCTCSR